MWRYRGTTELNLRGLVRRLVRRIRVAWRKYWGARRRGEALRAANKTFEVARKKDPLK